MRLLRIALAAFMLIVGIFLSILLSMQPYMSFGLWLLEGRFGLSPGLAVLPGILIGAAAVWLIVLRRDAAAPAEDKPHPLDRAALGGGVVAGAASGLLLLAVLAGAVAPLAAATVLLCGAAAFVALAYALQAIAKGDGVAFDSYWGGLGGAQGGWRISPATTLILLALVFIAATVTVATGSDRRSALGERRPADAGAEGNATETAGNGSAGNRQ